MSIELAFVDCETTGVDPDRHEVWEAAVIQAVHDGGKLRVTDEWDGFTWPRHLSHADAQALQVGRFYERCDHAWVDVAWEVATRTAGRVLIAANSPFDTAFLTAHIRGRGYAPAWHYSPVDVKSLAMGSRQLDPTVSTSAIAEQLGIDTSDLDAHTALDDARLAARIYAWVYDLHIEASS